MHDSGHIRIKEDNFFVLLWYLIRRCKMRKLVYAILLACLVIFLMQLSYMSQVNNIDTFQEQLRCNYTNRVPELSAFTLRHPIFENLTSCPPLISPFRIEMCPFVQRVQPTDCGARFLPLTYVDSSRLFLNESLISSFQHSIKLTCTYRTYYCESDQQICHLPEQTYIPINGNSSDIIDSPLVNVLCIDAHGIVMYEAFHWLIRLESRTVLAKQRLLEATLRSSKGAYRSEKAAARKQDALGDAANDVHDQQPSVQDAVVRLLSGRPPSVILLGIDGVSRQQMTRLMPLTRQYLEANALLFDGYHTVGPRSLPNMLALLAGLDESAAEGVKSADEIGWIMNKFNRSGYVTFYSEDQEYATLSNIAGTGFVDPHYLDLNGRSFWRMLGRRFTGNPQCLMGRRSYLVHLEQLRSLQQLCSQHSLPYFAVSFMNALTHDQSNLAQLLDADLRRWLAEQADPDALVVLFSDHGDRFSGAADTPIGHIEHNSPLLAVRVPARLLAALPKGYARSLMANSAQRPLVTPFDVHATLLELHRWLFGADAALGATAAPPGRSLFGALPPRGCAQAHISALSCTCLRRTAVAVDGAAVLSVAQLAVAAFNDALKAFRHECASLRLGRVLRAELVSEAQDELFYLVLETQPGAGRFELVADKDGQLRSSVHRLNVFRLQTCTDVPPSAAQFCYCRS